MGLGGSWTPTNAPGFSGFPRRVQGFRACERRPLDGKEDAIGKVRRQEREHQRPEGAKRLGFQPPRAGPMGEGWTLLLLQGTEDRFQQVGSARHGILANVLLFGRHQSEKAIQRLFGHVPVQVHHRNLGKWRSE